MRIFSAKWLAVVAIVAGVLSIPPLVGTIAGFFGLRWTALITLGGVPPLVRSYVGAALFLWLWIGLWLLARPGGHSSLLGAAAICLGIQTAAVVYLTIAKPGLPSPLLYSLDWLGNFALLLLSCGLLISGLTARWVGWVGVASAVASAAGWVPFAFRLYGLTTPVQSVGWFLGSGGSILETVFLLAVGVELLRTHALPASNKRIEQTPDARYAGAAGA